MTGGTVLIADPNGERASALERALTRLRIAARWVDSFEKTRETLGDYTELDALFLAAEGFDDDSFEFCRMLSRFTLQFQPPVIMVAPAGSRPALARQAMASGAKGLLSWPADDVTLAAWIEAVRPLGMPPPMAEEGPAESHGGLPTEALQTFAKLSHQVSNPLQGIFGSVDIIAMNVSPDFPHHDRLEEVLKYAKEVAHLVRDASRLAKDALK
ncbi:MAG: hypothetical protein ACLFV4_10185 [Candidatus Hydrogenedentota bacterium]